jgi:hypothetical protein
VVIITGEDNLDDTVKPRLVAAGANMDNVIAIETVAKPTPDGKDVDRGWTLADLPELERNLKIFRAENEDAPALVIIDPVSAYLAKADSHKDADVRQLLSPLRSLAARTGVAVIMVHHVNKSRGVKASHRVSGSVAFRNAARAAYFCAQDPTGSGFVMLTDKNNATEKQPPIAYRLEKATVDVDGCTMATSRLVWMGATNITEAEVLEAADSPTTKVGEAVEWLSEVLRDGERASDWLMERGKEEGYSRATLFRAKDKLDIRAVKRGMSWFWGLSKDEALTEPKTEKDGDGLAF